MKYALRWYKQEEGQTLWYKQMTAIGPMTTPIESERHLFETREGAMGSAAFLHMLSIYELVEVPDNDGPEMVDPAKVERYRQDAPFDNGDAT